MSSKLQKRDYSYSSNLTGVNGFDPFIKRSEEVLKSTQEISAWFKKISLMHETNAKALIKNASLSKKKKTYTSTIEIGSLIGAWRSFHLQLETLGNIELQASKDLLAESDKIANFVVEKTNARKKLVAEANKIVTEVKNSITTLQKAKANYDSKCKDADNAQQAYLKAKQDGNTKPKKVQELLSRSTKTMDTAAQADKDYQKALEKANERQSRYYETEMPSILELFQTFEEERLGFLKGVFQKIAQIESTLPPAYSECTKDYLQVSDDMTVSGDIQEYIEENIATIVAPTPLEYAPYETDNPNFKLETCATGTQSTTTGATRSTSNNDLLTPDSSQQTQYGLTDQEEVKLTNPEKIQKLQVQIAELQDLIKAEAASKKGMEKLVKFYAMDPKSQEKAIAELDDQKKKISSLKKTRRALERQLVDLDSPETMPANPEIEQTPTAATGVKARALYSYDATNDSELSFRGNDILNVTEQDESGWWFAELNGRSGFIPSNYMSLLP